MSMPHQSRINFSRAENHYTLSMVLGPNQRNSLCAKCFSLLKVLCVNNETEGVVLSASPKGRLSATV